MLSSSLKLAFLRLAGLDLSGLFIGTAAILTPSITSVLTWIPWVTQSSVFS